MFHVSALKAYKYFPDNYTPPPLPSVIHGHVEYEVDYVTNTTQEGKHREYLVHWVGYKESTWENVKNLTNYPENLCCRVLGSQRYALPPPGALTVGTWEKMQLAKWSARDEQTSPRGALS